MIDTDNDTVIFKYIQKQGRPVALKDIFKELVPKGTSFSEITIKKRLGKMVKQGKITRLKKDSLHDFGMYDDDGRKSYYVITDISKISMYFDHLLKIILSGNSEEIVSALEEIEIYKLNTILTPDNLDILCNVVDTNEEIFVRVISILQDYIIIKKIEPFNQTECIKNLKLALSKYRKQPELKEPINKIFQIFGFYSDIAVIDQLESDANDGDTLREWRSNYETPFTADVIDNNRERLRKLMISLKEKGRPEIVQIVKEIRISAIQDKADFGNMLKGKRWGA